MSAQARATAIAMLGPLVQGTGFLWMLADALLSPGRDLTLRYILFDPGPLMLGVGLALTVICLPIALQVAAAEPEELELTLPEPPPAGEEPSPGWPEFPESSWGATK